MRKILLSIALLSSLLLIPLTSTFAQEEPTTTVDDEILYQIQDDVPVPTLYNEGEEPVPTLYEDDSDGAYAVTISTQEPTLEEFIAVLIAYSFSMFLFFLISHIATAIPLYKLGKEVKYGNAWYAWIPLLNWAMLLHLGKKSAWLILLTFIPFVGPFILAVLLIIALMDICESRGYHKYMALLLLIPFGLFIILYLLAWKPKTPIASTSEVK